MLKKWLVLTGATAMMTGATLAGISFSHAEDTAPAETTQPKTDAKKDEAAPKLTEVKLCPVTQEAIVGKGAGTAVFETYQVTFCCGGCKKAWTAMKPETKREKIAATLKAQNAGTEANHDHGDHDDHDHDAM